MVDAEPSADIAFLRAHAQQILQERLVPKPLAKPPDSIQSQNDLKFTFDRAGVLYRVGLFQDAKKLFLEVAAAAEQHTSNAGIVPLFNAAACAAAMSDFDAVVELVRPIYNVNPTFGHPAWNLALAYYRLGQLSEALAAIQRWISRAGSGEKARGRLVAASLALELGNVELAQVEFSAAKDANDLVVSRYLGRLGTAAPQDDSRDLRATDRKVRALSQAEWLGLLRLLQPKKPERKPQLALTLSPDEMDRFSIAIEAVAERRFADAQAILVQLGEAYPQEHHLKMALAAAELFAGRSDKARDILCAIESQGQRLTGGGYWNLACAELRLKNHAGALRALELCSSTEYYNNGTLWQIINELSPQRGPRPRVHKTKLLRNAKEPQRRSLTETRVRCLARFIQPRKVDSTFKPDLGGLLRRDADAIEQILKEARKAVPSAAVSMLAPWMSRYPKIYTLKVHAAGYAVDAGLLGTAQRCLEEAQEIRPLDRISRRTLAHIYTKRQDFLRATQTFETGVTHLVENHEFWLTTAILRSLSGYGDPADAAGRALILATPTHQGEILKVLRDCRIQPAQQLSAVNPLSACGRETLPLLDRRECAEAAKKLLGACGEHFEEVPEVGKRTLQPWFERKLIAPGQSELNKQFRSAVRKFDDREFISAAQEFARLFDEHNYDALAINMIASYLTGQVYGKAQNWARRIARQRHSSYRWRLAYNVALASYHRHDHLSAVNILDKKTEKAGRAVYALALVCAKEGMPRSQGLRKKVLTFLEKLRESSPQPSGHLLLALAWANLVQETPQVDLARALISQAIKQAAFKTGIPPNEINSMQQVRAVYREMLDTGKDAEVLKYLKEIVEAREEERGIEGGELRGQKLARSIGVEFAALACLVQEYASHNDRAQAMQTLDQCELLVLAHEDAIDPGFIAKDWLEIARLGIHVNLPWASLRNVERGLRIDPESQDLKDVKQQLSNRCSSTVAQWLTSEVQNLTRIFSVGNDPMMTIGTLARTLTECGVLATQASATSHSLQELLQALQQHPDNPTADDDMFERVGIAARAELPADALSLFDKLLAWVSDCFSGKEGRSPVEVELFEDKVWPRSFEGQACGLIILTATGSDALEVCLRDPEKGTVIWQGILKPTHAHYQRWTFERDEGFLPDEQVDLLLTLQIAREQPVQLVISVTVGPFDPSWPDYPPGSLHPNEVPEGKLYGRGDFIRQIVSSFGQTRSRANYLIESVRQMGKTTVLFFIKTSAPSHVLPVYIDLERSANEPEGNVWNYIIEQVLREVGEPVTEPLKSRRHEDLIHLARSICRKTNKSYLLLLMDELHVLLRDADRAKSFLTDIRADLNQPDNKIAVLFADRYTKRESEVKVASELWLQVTEVKLGPLDRESTAAAIMVPCHGRDATFLPETIDRIYHWTSGYPFHVQRMVQRIIETNFREPWVAALPEDVDTAVSQMIDQDSLFREGLCRPERIDEEIQCAVAAYLEYKDLSGLLPTLYEDKDWDGLIKQFAPEIKSLLTMSNDPAKLLARLEDVGLMRRNKDHQYELFSALLENWLRKMRNERKPLYSGGLHLPWALSVQENVINMDRDAWMLLDSELARSCRDAGLDCPLSAKAFHNSWDILVRHVENEHDFQSFAQAAVDCFVEGRAVLQSLVRYPWLLLAYHRTRLVRNYFQHGTTSVSAGAIAAWKQVCQRALGGPPTQDRPKTAEEWRAVQLVILRTLEIGFRNAISIVSISKRSHSAS